MTTVMMMMMMMMMMNKTANEWKRRGMIMTGNRRGISQAHTKYPTPFFIQKKKKKRKMKKKILVDRTLNFKIFERVTCLAVKRLKKNKRETPNAFRFD